MCHFGILVVDDDVAAGVATAATAAAALVVFVRSWSARVLRCVCLAVKSTTERASFTFLPNRQGERCAAAAAAALCCCCCCCCVATDAATAEATAEVTAEATNERTTVEPTSLSCRRSLSPSLCLMNE